MKGLCIFFIFLVPVCASQIKSTTGNIAIDTNVDGVNEAKLSSSGLSIGTNSEAAANLHVSGNSIVTGELVLGGTSGNSTLEVQGTYGFSLLSISSNTTVVNNSMVIADTSSDNILVSLPFAGNVTGRQIKIKKASTSNKLWISGGGNSIDDVASLELSTASQGYPAVELISNGVQWYITRISGNIDTIAADNLIGWWKLDEASGSSSLDSSTQGNDGSITNMSSSDVGVSGYIQKAIDFDGTNDYVNLGESQWDGSPAGNSYAFWFKRQGSGTVGGAGVEFVLGKGAGNALGYGFGVNQSDSKFVARMGSSNSDSTLTVVNDTWYHVAVVVDSSNCNFYVNGVFTASVSFSYSGDNNLNFTIGSGGSNYFNGLIDDVRVYNKQITAAEVQAIYMQGL